MPSPPRPLAAVILAAGGSTRMGRAKALLDVDGQPWVAAHVRALSPWVERVLVVVGAEGERVRAALPAPAEPVENPAWATTGMAQSLALALARLPADAEALVTPVDAPPAPAAVLAALADRGGPLVPTAGGQDGHPVRVPVGPTLAVLRAGGTLRDALAGAPRLELGWAEGLRNVNTPEEYAAWRAARARPGDRDPDLR
ncbi:NTP transferase domain-containing protein [Myxococcota bacterium]|nr:NTP transferase domain-containing protein [Myxococcota bacterium]